MIKRRFYKLEHGERDGAASDESSSSSSDNDSDIEPQLSDNDDVGNDAKDDVSDDDNDEEKSGYENEGSSEDELVADRSGLIAKDDDSESESDKDQLDNTPLLPREENSEIVKTRSEVVPGVENIVLKSKSVFKCRLCPKIVCLNEESLATHLKSKRHARSEKLLNDGRLKRFLNSDGQEEVVSDDDEDGETHAERHARILALAQEELTTKKSRGRQRQRLRLKKKKQKSSEKPSTGQQRDNRAKRRKKNVD